MLGPIEDVLQDTPVASAACPPPSSRDRPPQQPPPAQAGQFPARFLAHRGRPRGRQLRAGGPGAAHRGTGVQLRIGDRAGRALPCAIDCRGAAGSPSMSIATCGRRSSSISSRTRSSSPSRARSRSSFAASAGSPDRRTDVVRDTGVGIPQSELPRLFERFHRIEGQKSRSFEGSGIGLALVQELVRLHGGTIEVESEEGEGAAFTISIPFGTAHLRRTRSASRARAPRPRCAPAPSSRRRCAGCRTTGTRTTRRMIAPTSRADCYLQGRTAERASWSPTTTPTCAPTSAGCSDRDGRWRRWRTAWRRWRRYGRTSPIWC